MGHLALSGEGGLIARMGAISGSRKTLVHINNSNPILLDDSAERRALDKEGWEVAYDGMEVGP